ncbi:MAG: GNAT family N-acetyltransferase [Dehalococcoidia bacterium]|nr:GNAT family N-acetyltransferase [Dehalococcoidia bacterium]
MKGRSSVAHEDVFLETDRLVIRNWRADDWRLIRPMSLDAEVMQYIGHYQPWSEDETRQFVSNRISDFKRHGWTMWPLVLKETRAFVGYCGFLRRMYGEYEGEIEIGYALAKDAWGKGLATEAAARILQYGFESLGFERVIASARPENARSIRVMEKMGMHSIGLSLNDKGRPVPHYAIENPMRQE